MVTPGRRSTRQAGPPHRGRLGLVFLLGVVVLGGLLLRAAHLQVLHGETWAQAAERQHRAIVDLPARRGAIVDRNGVPLGTSLEAYRVGIAPGEVRDPAAVGARLSEVLRLDVPDLAKLRDERRRWVELGRRITPDQREVLGRIPGVYYEREFERRYPYGGVTREVIGLLSSDDRPLGGVEQQFDAVLRGRPGRAVYRREPSGEARQSFVLPIEPARPGGTVQLTIDLALQEIAREALENAVRGSGARGGDVLIVDPRGGEILAAVSIRDGSPGTLAAFIEPFEPGSTMKPFVAAALLAEGRATLADTVYAEGGVWQAGNRRLIRDVERHGSLSLKDALRVSSNIAIVKFAQRMDPAQQWAYLRDFGFGSPTGIDYPSESAGRLARPVSWSALTPASLAMGYEVAVTPLQLVMAYGALANGGFLLEPRLVRSVRDGDGNLLARTGTSTVRRVVSTEVAAEVTDALVAAVSDGTASRASLRTFEVAGKTGTARLADGGNGYDGQRHTATFVGYFPARRPQIVFLVKLDEPAEEIYGGLVAAPVTRDVLHAALAIQANTIDGAELARVRGLRAGVEESDPRRMPELAAWRPPSAPTVFRMADEVGGEPDGWIPPPRALPDVRGLSMREATFRLHRMGVRVRIGGSGIVSESRPAAGEHVSVGDTVHLHGEHR